MAELEFVPTAIMKILKGRLITAMHTLGLFHFRGVSGVLASHTVLEKCFQCCCTLLVLAEELLVVLGGWVHVLSQLAVARLSPRKSVAQKWGEQCSWALSSQEGLFSPAPWQRLRSWKMREKQNIMSVQESKGNLSSLPLSTLQN